MKNIEDILNQLELNNKSDLLKDKSAWQSVFSQKEFKELKNEFNLYAVFCFDKRPLILFFDNPILEKELHKWVWNINKAVTVIIVKDSQNFIYNGLAISENGFLKELDNADKLDNFNYLKLVTGETWEAYKEQLTYKNRVDYKLLENLEAVRIILINLLKNEEKIKRLTSEKEIIKITSAIANTLIGRLLFIKYLIDRKVTIHFPNVNDYFSHQDLLNTLQSATKTYTLFQHLKDTFNGDLFPFIGIEKTQINEKDIINEKYLDCFIQLFNGDEIKVTEIRKSKKTGKETLITKTQKSLFPLYDFSIIPIEFISNIYEQFIGKDNQEAQGAYYTPVFLVNYILDNTVAKFLSIKKDTYNCKVLDPACGSGIFLVETLRKLIEKYQSLNPDYLQNKSYKDDLRNIVWSNIFGVDKDRNAIDVAIFSLYITLLDYQEPADIESFKLPQLKNRNFFEADFFDENKITKDIFQSTDKKSIEFDFIIGNPPWGKVEDSEKLYDSYWKEREKKESEILTEQTGNKKAKVQIKVSDKDICQAFMIRASDFCKSETQIVFIIKSTILYKLQGDVFRKYWLNQFFIDRIFEISSVRREIFERMTKGSDESIAPCAVVFYKYAFSKYTKDNELTHISLKPNLFFKLFKLFVIEKNDVKKVLQARFEDDWLFKLLVYGNVLDFELIKKLKGYDNIKTLQNSFNLFVGPGAKATKGKNDASFLEKMPFLDTEKGMLKQYYIEDQFAIKRKFGNIDRARNPETYKPPSILVKLGLDNKFEIISALSQKEYAFTDSISVIKGDYENIDVLYSCMGFLNSKILTYYVLLLGVSIGIEREKISQKEIFNYPIILSKSIIDLSKKIENIFILNQGSLFNQQHFDLEQQKNKLLETLNNQILEAFDLSNQEKALVDYALTISIPLLQDKEALNYKNAQSPIRKLHFEDAKLNEYVQVLLDFFQIRFTNNVGIKIYYSDYAICVYCYRTDEVIKEPISWQKLDANNIFSQFLKTGFDKVTDKLYLQKDIKGFEKQGFYVVKPNEYKVWHKAIAYLDAFEFNEVLNQLKVKHGRPK